MSVMSNLDLDARERRDALVAAGGWPADEPDQPAPLALGAPARGRPVTAAEKAAVSAADVPADADSPYHVGGFYCADPSLAAYVRDQLAERAARDEARRRAALAAFPGQLDEVREALDAVAAQDASEREAA